MILYKTRALLQWDLGCGAHFNLHLQAGATYLALLQFRVVSELSEDTFFLGFFFEVPIFLPLPAGLHI